MDYYLSPLCAVSVFVAHVLHEKGNRVLGFCDSNTTLHDYTCYGFNIFKPEDAYHISPSATVVICSIEEGNKCAKMLITAGFTKVIKLNKDLIKDNRVNFINEICNKIDWNIFLDLMPKVPTEKLSVCYLPYEIKRQTLFVKQQFDDEIVLRSTEFVITEKCTLKCKHCTSLFQYYTNPIEHNQDDICNSVDSFMSIVDFVGKIIVIGGEVFISGDNLAKILLHVFKYNYKYGAMIIITNGTIVPSEESLKIIKQTCVYIRISDYGRLSRKKEELINRLIYWKIPFEVTDVPWYDMHKLNIDNGENTQKVFDNCDLKVDFATVLKSRWYYCEFLANAENLNAIPNDPNNSFFLMNKNLTKKDFQDFIYQVKAPPGCQYCSGGMQGKLVKAGAEQLSSPLPYKRYK